MTDRKFSVEDKYRVLEGRIAITGVQALVRVTLDQQRRDRAAGLHTATFVTGYQGSPLGELDKQFMKAGRLLEEHDIVWQAGINEELAATAVYGSQLVHTFPKPKYDGVLGMWYGKSPGVDRSMGRPQARKLRRHVQVRRGPSPGRGRSRLQELHASLRQRRAVLRRQHARTVSGQSAGGAGLRTSRLWHVPATRGCG